MGLASFTRRLTRRRAQLTFFSSLALVCLLATAFLATQVFFKLDDYATASRDNVSWSLAQLEVEQLKLLSALQTLDPDDPATVALLNRRFDALYSRRGTIAVGPVYHAVLSDPKARDALTALSNAIDEVEPLLSASDDDLAAARETMIQQVRTMSEPIRELVRAGVASDARAKERERQKLTSKLLQVTGLSLILLIALMSLAALLWQLYRLYRQRAIENRQVLRRLSTILDTSQDAILVVCRDGCIIDTNRAANAMFFDGKQPNEPPQISDILMRRSAGGEFNPVSGEKLLASCADGPNLCANVVGQTPSGEVFPVELSADKALRGGHEVVICFLRNIARRMADHAALLAARDRALSGEQAKARFLSMVSHEMRTPLTGILGALELLNDTPMSNEQSGYARIMRSSGQLLLKQINDALDVAQAEQGALSVTAEQFDLDTMLDTLYRSQAPEAQKSGTKMHLSLTPEPMGVVIGDRNRVHQVLLNLVANAVKFTRQGEIRIDAVRLEDDKGPSDIVEFQVSDTGIGIPEADQAAIFEDFVRLDAPDAHDAHGAGLGLGIVRTLVSLLGGEIGVESEPGEGSLFWVRLPLPPVQDQSASPAPRDAAPLPEQLDILIVEDNDINRQVISELLSRDGHKVTEAVNGQDAVDKTQTHRFDVILMDVNMPVLDGLAATRRIRAGQGPSSTARILALTAHVTPDSAEQVRKAGLDGLLHKPLQRDELSQALGPHSVRQATPELVWLDDQILAQLHNSLSPQALTALFDGFDTQGRALLDRVSARSDDELIAHLHELAGLAATIGARRLHAHLSAAEASLRGGAPQEADALLKDLPQLWHSTQDRLTSLRKAA
ncbi:response regulator [Roseovarius faecimaris]|uniref:histidine kinase n=1 Tax=Roseovarius faecimaris TaxID=2494550 RepID=A0A6I6IMY1_9RHOB|nr:ATP-binding protein [Roseovarius faecimaris]QGX98389.1 response regulator [Roseovarius faecimaris]